MQLEGKDVWYLKSPSPYTSYSLLYEESRQKHLLFPVGGHHGSGLDVRNYGGLLLAE